MAAVLNGVLEKGLSEQVKNSNILVVGAGGIGCELLKNLVLTGFKTIEVIDLDTIDVSNLNRQFLFRKEHVGRSKAQVAKESVLNFNPNVSITAYHDSVMSPDYDVNFFKKFTLVMNALDNKAARNHVNRMCLAADVPLVESGSAGYLGQVTVIKKGQTECYECRPKPVQKTFPGCTIRNTPSEPIHCVVWAKHLFNQLFGELDPDQDVSPDTEDPELTAEAGQTALLSEAKIDEIGGLHRKSTRAWAQEVGYNPEKLFNKFFRDDIKYLLSMKTLWKKRVPPTPLDMSGLPENPDMTSNSGVLRDQKLWGIKECADVFAECLESLKKDLATQGDGGVLVWDKDDTVSMDFVTSVANIRAYIFGIPMKTRFQIKSMAGNIIPAIATTNAVIAGLIIMEAFKILGNRLHSCKEIYLNRVPNDRNRLLIPCCLNSPNPKCYVCAPKPEVTVVLNTTTFKVGALQDKVLKSHLGMVAPDVEIDDMKGTILISSEEGETEENNDKFLSDFGVRSGTRLKCDDFLQVYSLNIIVAHVEKLEGEKDFEVVGDLSELQPQQEKQKTNGQQELADKALAANDEDDLMIIDSIDDLQEQSLEMKGHLLRKRKVDDEVEESPKRRRLDSNEDSGVIEIS
ncbi:SUMO-activating enzyme subunit 2-like isoform X2 [Pomacea canaliculata]|uniref:SUMO-activating enzyme subunit 2-like isoform X2 n=1 Tax=Pomacea canaliculata TaxID=400727 RepID=UPI000D73866E|nr:SUMO-activating enzyme subunit 2-like isoform X2 [Pomacea canaliculata]